jgi:hypothetical protein
MAITKYTLTFFILAGVVVVLKAVLGVLGISKRVKVEGGGEVSKRVVWV